MSASRIPGRLLRALAGVDEDVLDRVPGERARWTSLGGIVLGTATVAALSMWAALQQVLGRGSPALLLPVLVWGLFVLTLDRWLVASTGGVARRAAWVVPRVLVAVVFGIIIAEPLVLRAFETAVEQRVRDDRARQLVAYESTLRACNLAGSPPAGVDCTGLRLTVAAGSGGADRATIAALEDERRRLEDRIERSERRLAALNDTARRECNGTPGEGLTGLVGVGPNCERLRREADAFARTSGIAADADRIQAITAELERLRPAAGRTAADHEQALRTAIRARVGELRASQGPIGLLERFAALDVLTGQSGFLRLARWLLTLFLIVVDCLPVIVKLLSGATAYERMVEAALRGACDTYTAEAELTAAERATELALRRERLEAGARLERERIELETRAEIDALRARLGTPV